MKKFTALLLTIMFLITMLPSLAFAHSNTIEVPTVPAHDPGPGKALGTIFIRNNSHLPELDGEEIIITLSANTTINSCTVTDTNNCFNSIASDVYSPRTAIIQLGNQTNFAPDVELTINITADLTNLGAGQVIADVFMNHSSYVTDVTVATSTVDPNPFMTMLNSGKQSTNEIYQCAIDLSQTESGSVSAIVYKYDNQTTYPYSYSIIPQSFDDADNKITRYFCSENYRFPNTLVCITGAREQKLTQILAMGDNKDAAMSAIASNIPYILGVVDAPGGGGGDDPLYLVQPIMPTPTTQQSISLEDAAALISSIINGIIRLFS